MTLPLLLGVWAGASLLTALWWTYGLKAAQRRERQDREAVLRGLAPRPPVRAWTEEGV